MNLLEAIKQIAEHSDKDEGRSSSSIDERQYFFPPDEAKAGHFPRGYFGARNPSGTPYPEGLIMEMARQTAQAQQTPSTTTLKDVRLNPDAVARFIREQEPSQNIENRRGQPPPDDQFDPSLLDAPPLRYDPFDPLAQLLGINSIGPRATTVPDEPVPLPRPRPRR